MKIIVCGADQVGSSIARHLAGENNDVTVVDHSPELIRNLSNTHEVKGVVGFASHPSVLEKAGAADADMVVAVTYHDEVNIIACQLAHSLFKVPTKIARIREQSYLEPIWADLFSRDNIPIDVIISPEAEIAKAIGRRLQIPGAFDSIPLAEDKVRVIGVRCDENCPIINTPLRQLTGLFPDLNILVVGIIRKDQLIVPNTNEQMLAGDEVYFVVESSQVSRAMMAFGHEEVETRRTLIIGGGNIGLYLATSIEESFPEMDVKLIECNESRAEIVGQALQKTVVLCGDGLDQEILNEASVAHTETVVAVTNEDEINILSSLLAKRHGAKRVITLVNNTTYKPLITDLGIDVVVTPETITVSTILQHVRRGRIRSVHSLGDGMGEIIELEALETSPLVGQKLKDIKLPLGVIVGAMVREDEIIIPSGSTVIKGNDLVVLFASTDAVKEVEKMFSVRLEYF